MDRQILSKQAQTIGTTYESQVRDGDRPLWGLWSLTAHSVTHLGGQVEGLRRLALMLRSLSQWSDVFD